MKKENILLIILIISCIILIFITMITCITKNIIIDTIFFINVFISLYICIYLIRNNHKENYIPKIESE